MRSLLALAFVILSACVGSAVAQSSTSKPDSDDDGTDPTRLTATASTSVEHLDLRGGKRSDTLTLRYTIPVPWVKGTSVQFKMPFGDTDVLGDSGLRVGDFSVKLNHVLERNRSYGVVLNFELVFNTAYSDDRGNGQLVGKYTATYAKFLPQGDIFAPTIVHSESLSTPESRARVSNTGIDFYYVPRLPQPFFMTIDPQVVHDWVTGIEFGNLSVRMGYKLGKHFGGDLQAILKPSVGVGRDRPSNWGVEFEVKLINF